MLERVYVVSLCVRSCVCAYVRACVNERTCVRECVRARVSVCVIVCAFGVRA